MDNLFMPIDEIRNQIRFNCGYLWNNNHTTNCYAYALGIDIPEEEIIIKAYQPGTIGSIIFNIKPNELENMSLEEKVYADLEALNISYNECDQSDISCYDFDKDFITNQWIIALFSGNKDDWDFHFMRKSLNNVWWHKRGYSFSKPSNFDDNFETIYNPKECKLYDYNYVKCLKLNCKLK